MSDQELQPEQQANGVNRDTKGRLLPGHKLGHLGGRPRGFDIRDIAEKRAEAEGIDLKEALWRVIKTLLAAAEKGDVAAAKLVLDRLTDSDPLSVRLMHDHALSDVDLRARLTTILGVVQVRQELCE